MRKVTVSVCIPGVPHILLFHHHGPCCFTWLYSTWLIQSIWSILWRDCTLWVICIRIQLQHLSILFSIQKVENHYIFPLLYPSLHMYVHTYACLYHPGGVIHVLSFHSFFFTFYFQFEPSGRIFLYAVQMVNQLKGLYMLFLNVWLNLTVFVGFTRTHWLDPLHESTLHHFIFYLCRNHGCV